MKLSSGDSGLQIKGQRPSSLTFDLPSSKWEALIMKQLILCDLVLLLPIYIYCCLYNILLPI